MLEKNVGSLVRGYRVMLGTRWDSRALQQGPELHT
jgi:hypothetical protein